jgi:GNAT superfamily N-acetyltransferase
MTAGGSQEAGRETSELRLSGLTGAPTVAGSAVRTAAALAGISPRRLTGVRAIAEELVVEALARPKAAGDDDVVVRTRIHAGTLEIEVIDRGLPVKGGDAASGRARHLAALGYVDSLEVAARGTEGNVARCTIHLDPEALVAATGLVEKVLPPDAPPATDEDAAAVELRRMRPEDATELVRCVYRCYGYSYLAPMLYDPAGIRRSLAEGEMISVVGAAPDGTIVAHSAVIRAEPGDAVAEGGRLVVDPRYRGRGFANRMAAMRLDIAREQGYYGVWAECVTNHTASQQEVITLGGAETGLLIGAEPETMAAGMTGFGPAAGGRPSFLVCFTALRPHAETVYAPVRHAEALAEIGARLGIERRVEQGAPAAPGSASVLASEVQTFGGVARMRVDAIGADLNEQVADTLDSFAAFDLAAVHLDLPLSRPAAAAAASGLERLGFCFGAWMPSFAGGADVLRLQRVGSHPVDVASIACARPEGEAVRDYVLADWRRVRAGEFDP